MLRLDGREGIRKGRGEEKEGKVVDWQEIREGRKRKEMGREGDSGS